MNAAAARVRQVRTALAQAHPRVAFDVRQRTWSGQPVLEVSWLDGPSPADVYRPLSDLDRPARLLRALSPGVLGVLVLRWAEDAIGTPEQMLRHTDVAAAAFTAAELATGRLLAATAGITTPLRLRGVADPVADLLAVLETAGGATAWRAAAAAVLADAAP